MKRQILYRLITAVLVIMICLSPCITSNAEEISYDENGRVIEVVHEDGTVTKYIYDDNGNIISVRNYDSEKLAEEDEKRQDDNSKEDTNTDTFIPVNDNTEQDIIDIKADKDNNGSDIKKTEDYFKLEYVIIIMLISFVGTLVVVRTGRRYKRNH